MTSSNYPVRAYVWDEPIEVGDCVVLRREDPGQAPAFASSIVVGVTGHDDCNPDYVIVHLARPHAAVGSIDCGSSDDPRDPKAVTTDAFQPYVRVERYTVTERTLRRNFWVYTMGHKGKKNNRRL